MIAPPSRGCLSNQSTVSSRIRARKAGSRRARSRLGTRYCWRNCLCFLEPTATVVVQPYQIPPRATVIASPFTAPAASLQRNAITCATSIGSNTRFCG